MLPWWSFATLLLLTWQTTTNVAEARKVSTNAILIQRALHATFAAFEESPWPKPHPDVPLGFSQIHDQCHHLTGTADIGRIGCCTPNDVKHLYNVLIEDRKLVVFVPSLKEKDTKAFKLPPVQSVRNQKKVNHQLQVEYREGPMDIDKHCTRYFNGTLHFPGRSTVHNVYHALADNVLRLMSQIVLDYYLAGDMLYRPRMILTNFQPYDGRDPLRQLSTTNRRPVKRSILPSYQTNTSSTAPHLRLMEDVMSDGALSLAEASGTCFRRLVWGHGPYIFYTAMMQKLRRMVARFAREFALQLVSNYEVAHPQSLWHRWNEESNLDVVSKLQSSLVSENKSIVVPTPQYYANAHGRPLKAIVYTRGSSGKGRTIQNEHMLVQALRNRGAEVFICCNFANTSLEQQLYYALHADIILGMHGAALTHGVFMAPGTITLELKTLYAYDSILFPLVSDSHLGIHSQVNIKKYFIPGGQRPIDDSLVTRVMRVLDRARAMQHKLGLYGYDEGVRGRSEMLAVVNANTTTSRRLRTVPKPLKGKPISRPQSQIGRKRPAVEPARHDFVVSDSPSVSQSVSKAVSSVLSSFISTDVTSSAIRPDLSTGSDGLEQRITCSTSDLVDFVDGSSFRSIADAAKGNSGPAPMPAPGVPVKGDLVFGVPCSDLKPEVKDDKDNDGLRHVLGPMQQGHSRQCQQSIYQAWRVALENKEEGIHCRMCDPYVL